MNDYFHSVARAGSGLARWTLEMNIWAGAVLVVAAVFDRLLARRVAPMWRAALYVAVLVRLALPSGFASPVGVFPLAEATVFHVQHRETALDRNTVAAQAPPAAVAGETSPSQLSALSAAEAGGVLVVALYGLGVVALISMWVRSARRLHSVVARGRVVEAARVPAAGGVEVVEHDSAGPMLVGVIRPRLLIPSALLATDRARDLACVLRHESEHARRLDPVLAMLLHAVCIAVWPIAAVWVGTARVRALMEQACDEAALRGAGEAERREYAGALLSLATGRGIGLTRGLSPALPFGAGVRSRIAALVPRRRWNSIAQGGVAMLLTLAMVACAAGRGGSGKANAARMSGAEATPFKGSVGVQVTVLRTWPEHPKLDFRLMQTGGDRPRGEGGASPGLLAPDEWAEVFAGAQAMSPNAVLASPRLEMVPGLPATVRIGKDGASGEPVDGISAGVNITRVFSEAGSSVWNYRMDAEFERFGDERTTASSARVRDVDVPAGSTLAVLATGMIGVEQVLVCITPRPAGPTVRTAQPARAEDRWPKVEITALMDEIASVEAMESILMGIGGARNDYSALDIDRALAGAVVYSLPEEQVRELVKRATALPTAGYSRGSSPTVLVLPGQEAILTWESALAGGGMMSSSHQMAVKAVLGAPADRPGAVDRGTLGVGTKWTLPQSKKVVNVPPTVIRSYHSPDRAAALVVLAGPEITGEAKGRMLVLTARRYGSVAEMPVQVFSVEGGQ